MVMSNRKDLLAGGGAVEPTGVFQVMLDHLGV
jgi:hypothetical protein